MPKDNYLMEKTDGCRGWVSVGWSKTAELVQIGTEIEPLVKGAPSNSLWVDFPNRATINALIRSLRKARDEAFGRDE